MARIIALDFGKQRTGIAVTDELQLIASGLVTVNTKELLKYLQDYIAQENIERIVVVSLSNGTIHHLNQKYQFRYF